MRAMPGERRWRATISILGLAAAHFVASRWLFLIAFHNEMSRFDTAEPLSPQQLLVARVSRVLDFPVALVLDAIPIGWFPALWGYVPFFVNSLIWGTALYWGAAVCARMRRVRG